MHGCRQGTPQRRPRARPRSAKTPTWLKPPAQGFSVSTAAPAGSSLQTKGLRVSGEEGGQEGTGQAKGLSSARRGLWSRPPALPREKCDPGGQPGALCRELGPRSGRKGEVVSGAGGSGG